MSFTVKRAVQLPVVCLGYTFNKKDDQFVAGRYNGLVLLNVGNLANCSEAIQVCRKATESLQTLFAFIGSGGKNVKIVVPLLLRDNTVPQNESLVRFFHAHAQ